MRCLELLQLSLRRQLAIRVHRQNFVPEKLAQLVARYATFLFVDDPTIEPKLFGTAQIVA
jgi:UDP-N-acetylglucosamine:LPS N-acetylglucosamine transferase